MRVSSYFKLGRAQSALDFVDVDVTGDTRVFISPRALQMLPSDWGDECVYIVQTFFETVLKLIKSGKNDLAENLLRSLREPNETHLGLSKGKARGRALGEGSAKNVWRALSTSAAAKSGMLKDLEDTILVIEGVALRAALLARANIKYVHFVGGIWRLTGCSVKQLLGEKYQPLKRAVDGAYEVRNKIFHGQQSGQSLDRKALIAMQRDVREWCIILAAEAFLRFGYDGFGRDSLHKTRNNNIVALVDNAIRDMGWETFIRRL